MRPLLLLLPPASSSCSSSGLCYSCLGTYITSQGWGWARAAAGLPNLCCCKLLLLLLGFMLGRQPLLLLLLLLLLVLLLKAAVQSLLGRPASDQLVQRITVACFQRLWGVVRMGTVVPAVGTV
jgi:hypothetical protein